MVRALFPTPPSPTTTSLYVGRLSLGKALVAMATSTVVVKVAKVRSKLRRHTWLKRRAVRDRDRKRARREQQTEREREQGGEV